MNSRSDARRAAVLWIAAFCAAIAAGFWAHSAGALKGETLSPSEAKSLQSFLSPSSPLQEADYANLFSYFLEGFVEHQSRYGPTASFPGWAMGEGTRSDRELSRLEGFSRTAPLLASWLNGGRPGIHRLPSGRVVDLGEIVRKGTLNGTDPNSEGYWGTLDGSRVVEAANVALSLWLSRRAVWDNLQPSQKQQIAGWLLGVNGKTLADNNWHLFVVRTNLILHALGMPADLEEASRRYLRFKSFYYVLGRSRRPENTAARYGAEYYSSSTPFCGCER